MQARVAVLIVAHAPVAAGMLETVAGILGDVPLPAKAVGVAPDCDPDALRATVRAEIERLDEGKGVLILTDLFGATPSNVAASVADSPRVRMVSGINLPMLLRVMNYPELGLAELAEKAETAGRDGVMACHGVADG